MVTSCSASNFVPVLAMTQNGTATVEALDLTHVLCKLPKHFIFVLTPRNRRSIFKIISCAGVGYLVSDPINGSLVNPSNETVLVEYRLATVPLQ